MKTTRILNQYDIERIQGFLSLATQDRNYKYRNLIQLKTDIILARICEPEDIPLDVVTINSEVRIKGAGSSQPYVVKLVFPQEAGLSPENVSLLTPLGAALLGRGVDDTIVYTAPGGEIEITILEIMYQPEAAGDLVS